MADPQTIAQTPPPSKSVRQNFLDYLMDEKRLPSIGKELAYAVADIRQKVVEEATYGRAVTPDLHAGDPLGRAMPAQQPEAAEPGGHGHDR